MVSYGIEFPAHQFSTIRILRVFCVFSIQNDTFSNWSRFLKILFRLSMSKCLGSDSLSCFQFVHPLTRANKHVKTQKREFKIDFQNY